MLQGVHRLIIVPHGVLAQLPFAALVDERSGRFVVQDFDVMYLPSAGTLPALRQPGGGVRRSPLGGSAFAPFPGDLPASAGEVDAVRRAMPGVAERIGEQATEQAVLAALAEPGIVHVASHGVLNSRNPMFTRIELASASPSSASRAGAAADHDGRLEIHELLAASIRSPLVFLSGCETSVVETWLDDAVRGTDHTTLAQAPITRHSLRHCSMPVRETWWARSGGSMMPGRLLSPSNFTGRCRDRPPRGHSRWRNGRCSRLRDSPIHTTGLDTTSLVKAGLDPDRRRPEFRSSTSVSSSAPM
jgi:hypothetical protein